MIDEISETDPEVSEIARILEIKGMVNRAEVGKTYKHFKGNKYKILHIAQDSKTSKEVIVYQDVLSNKIWVRDRKMFEEYLIDKKVFRFEMIDL